MDRWITLYFQATGAHFQPFETGLSWAASFAPGTEASFGGRKGKVVAHGGALYRVPDGLPTEPGKSAYETAFAHLAALQPALRTAGATDFVLHLRKASAGPFLEEFTRSELRCLAALDCHLFIASRPDGGDGF